MLSLQKLSSTKLNLNANEYHFPLHQDADIKIIEKNIYPRSAIINEKLIKSISQRINVSPQHIIVTNGSQSALAVILRYKLGKVMLAIPSFVFVEKFLQINNIDYTSIDVFSDVDVNRFEKEMYIYKPDVVYFSNPSTPFGILINKDRIQSWLTQLPNTLIIVDEAYIEYVGEEYSVSSLINKYSNIVITRTFSKFYGIPSARIGYLLSTDKNYHNLCSNVDVTDFARLIALNCLNNHHHYEQNSENMKRILNFVSNELSDLNVDYHVSYNSVSFVIYNYEVNVLSMILRYKFDIIVNVPYQIPNTIRVTVSTKENMIKFITALKESLEIMKELVIELPLKKYYDNIQDLISINEPFIYNVPIIELFNEDDSLDNVEALNAKAQIIEVEIDLPIHKLILEMGFDYDRTVKLIGRKTTGPLHRDGTNSLNILRHNSSGPCEFIIIPEEERHKIKKQAYIFADKNECIKVLQDNNVRVFLSGTTQPGQAIIFQSELPHGLLPGTTVFINHNYKNTIRDMIQNEEKPFFN